MNVENDTFARRAPKYAPSEPIATAPQMPSPPFQILKASTQVAARAEVGAGRGDDVINPAADDPEGIAQTAISSIASTSPPRATQRRRVIHTAKKMPMRIMIAYACTVRPPN